MPSYIASAPSRLAHKLRRSQRHTHLIFLICDHFEPRHGIRDEAQAAERMRQWRTGYGEFQQRCQAEFGTSPLHTWFYPPHHGNDNLADLSAMAHAGLGEVELHYHHDGDTAQTLERDLRATIDEYNRWGLLMQSGTQPTSSFGFIHGDWALGNSGGGHHCGVNDELSILQKLGCWADLTMPSSNHCQTRKINSIYYGKGNPAYPKGHDWGPSAQFGKSSPDGLMLIQGPLGINWAAPSYPRIENASLTNENWGRPDRIRSWINANVHVQGQPDWLFIKLHTHGAIEKDFDALFGDKAIRMHRELNSHYNDGQHFSLHYVTARQSYNIAKAAEAGKTGNPSDYLDFRIAPPTTQFYSANVRHTIEHCTPTHLKLSNIEPTEQFRLQLRVGPVTSMQGAISGLNIDTERRELHLQGPASLTLSSKPDTRLDILEGGQWLSKDGDVHVLSIAERCRISYQ